MMTTAQEFERRRWHGAGAALRRPVRGRPRRLDRQRRAADDRRRARLLPGQPLLGRQRLRAHLRRLPAARRPARRPARPAAGLHGRPRPVRARLAGRRLRRERRRADRRARRPGPRRRDRLARRALDRHHHLPRRRGAQQGARRLGRGRRLRRRRRRPARRRAHRVPRLGVGALGQRADRDRRRASGAAPDRREPLEAETRHFDIAGAITVTAGLSLLVYALVDATGRGLGLDPDDRAAGRCGRAARSPSSRSSAARRRRWSRSRSSACGR